MTDHKLSDKRWILKHVLVPILLAIIPCYFAWVQGRAAGRGEDSELCLLEREANRVIIRTLLEQIRDMDDHESPTFDPTLTGPSAVTDGIRLSPGIDSVEDADWLSESFADGLLEARGPGAQPEQAQQHIQQVIREYEELEMILPEDARASMRVKLIEGAKR